jgi:hypothetical protein
VLANRRWHISSSPFTYVTATNVFTEPIYSRLESAFRSLLEQGLFETPTRNRFSRIFRNYDAYGAHVPKDSTNALTLLLTNEWHDLLASVFNLDVTRDVSIELHHHSKGSLNGSVHNDFNPGWFLENHDQSVINVSGYDCAYRTGKTMIDGRISVQRMRALACIFYIANETWHRGEGGETGLYKMRDAPVDQPDVTVPPINNTLVAFPITPYTFHCFMGNNRHARNAIIFWLHRKYEDAKTEWGSKAIVHWK